MRLHEAQRTVAEWAAFFVEAHQMGVETIHVSNEYDGWDMTCAVFREVAQRTSNRPFRFVAKLGEPHFDRPEFDADRFAQAVDGYRDALGIDCLQDVQWMWRADLKADAVRIQNFERHIAQIRDAAQSLKGAGRIERLLCFPYSVAFADAASSSGIFDGIIVYRNHAEREYDEALDRWHTAGRMAHIIRPFLAGAALESIDASPAQQLADALNHPAIEAAILSTSKLDHLRALIS
jgi:hypothetical protein